MPPRVWPENPTFQNPAEEAVFQEFYKTLSDKDALFPNLHLTDPINGDVEIDLIALIHDLGVVVIETKGGFVSYNGQTFIQSDRGGGHPIYPHEQVLKNLYAFKTFLRNRWSYGNIKSEWILAFPFSHFGQVKIPGVDRDRIADRDELVGIHAKLNHVMTFVSNKNSPRYADWVERAFDAVKGHSMIETDPQASVANNYLQVKQMTHERRAILEMIQENNRIYVRGPAGSGKSWLAFEQAKMWADQGLRVGITMYNQGLASYMKRKVAEEGLTGRIGFVGNFHEFAELLGRDVEGPKSLTDDWLKDPNLLSQALDHLPLIKRFDAWVVDEAQDFDEHWWKVIFETLRHPSDGKIAIFGDPQQTLYGDKGWSIQGFATIRLTENLRNSQQIARSVESLVQDRIKALGPNSFEVEYIEVESDEDVLDIADDAVAHMADEEFWNPGEIALLTTKYRHPVHADKRGDQDSYWEEFWNGTDVFYGTVQGFKGLERSVVVLAVNGIHPYASVNDLLYVGMTRARYRLVVVSPAGYLDQVKAATIV